MAGREVRVAIIGDPSSLQRALRTSETGLAGFQRKMQNFGSQMRSVGVSLTRGLTLPIIGFGVLAARELGASERALAQTEAVIESTGGAARKTSEDIVNLSQSLSRMSSIDDEPIQDMANVLLTFRGIVGPTFDRATRATLDLSVAMDRDLSSSAVMVGRALNDPIRGMASLTRVGVQFTQEQRDAITAMVAFGDTAGAQRIILEELNTEFGGSAEALGGTVTGRLNRLKNRLEEVGASILENLLPAFESIADFVDRAADAFDNLTPAQQRLVAILIAVAAAAGPVVYVIGALVAIVAALISPIGLVVLGIAALAAAVYYAYTNWGWFKTGVDAAWQALQAIARALWQVGALAVDAIGQIIHWVNNVIQKIREWFNVTRPIREALVRLGQITFGALTSAISGILGVLGQVIDAVQTAIGLFRTLNSLGGGVPQPSGHRSDGVPIFESSFIPRTTRRSGTSPDGNAPITRAEMQKIIRETVSPVVVVGAA